jgi:hypothetical protein
VAAWVQLQSLAVGEVGAIPFQVTAKDATGITLAPVTRNPTTGGLVQNGSVVVAAAGTVSGPGWSTDPRIQPVLQQARQLQAGDLLKGKDGQVTMVLVAGLGPDGLLWSPYPDGHGAQPQDGFAPAGHATPPP